MGETTPMAYPGLLGANWGMPQGGFGNGPMAQPMNSFSLGQNWGTGPAATYAPVTMASDAVAPVAGSTIAAAGPTWWDRFAGRTDNKTGITQHGWGSQVLGGLQAFGNMYMGAQQLKMAKQALEENRRQFNMNWDAQRTLTNSHLEDRQKARFTANRGNGVTPVEEYMAKNGVK